MKKEYAIWATRNGMEDIVRINGQEVQKDLSRAKQIKKILEEKGFQKVRIQTIDMNNFDLKSAFIGGIKQSQRRRR